MRDIPVFTTAFGVASLGLKEIPYRGAAYIKIQDTVDPEQLIEECRNFCCAAGAEHIYAAGHPSLEVYPFHTAVWSMRSRIEDLPETDAALFPVQEKTLNTWVDIYNRKMADIPNAAYMTAADARKMLDRGDGYFIHREETLLGIGIAAGGTIDAVIAVQPGAGADVTLALTHALSSESVSLEVASANKRAVRLYERLGFIRTAELSVWYKIN